MNQRGIVRRSAYLYKNGFHRSSAVRIAGNQVWEIRFSNLEKLCLLLNCTPNDLFQWKPDEGQEATENTALKALVRDKAEPGLAHIVKDFPLEKLEKVKTLLKQLKEEDAAEETK